MNFFHATRKLARGVASSVAPAQRRRPATVASPASAWPSIAIGAQSKLGSAAFEGLVARGVLISALDRLPGTSPEHRRMRQQAHESFQRALNQLLEACGSKTTTPPALNPPAAQAYDAIITAAVLLEHLDRTCGREAGTERQQHARDELLDQVAAFRDATAPDTPQH